MFKQILFLGVFSILSLSLMDAGFAQLCKIGANEYESGTAKCLSSVGTDTQSRSEFVCTNGMWVDTNTSCPADVTSFCILGDVALEVGTRLAGTEGLAFVCRSPGGWEREAVSVATSTIPRARVLAVRAFLIEDGFDGASAFVCPETEASCEVSSNDSLMQAIIALAQQNFSAVSEFRTLWGIPSQSQVSSIIQTKAPAVVIDLFHETFNP